MSTEQPGTDVFEEIDPDPDAVLAEFGVESPDELAAEGGAHDTVPDDRIDVDDTTAAELFADLEAQATETRAAELEDRDSDGSTDSTDSTDAPADQIDGASPSEFEEFEAAVVAGREDEGLVESTAAELNAVAERVVGSDETAAADETEAPLESGVILEAEAPTGSEEPAAADEGDGEPVPEARSAAGTDTRDTARSDDSASDRSLTVSHATADELELVGPDPTTTRIDTDAFGRAGADGN
ncbi:sugar ABC transporter substrate-binding protein [Natrinema versiforme]|uniref:Sugar ABC transporter substrate-binding protein n=1 Tax=Natrinema versiforme TaxID=88724 RepID=A0A4V6MBD0_9EURY|nr:sugar ABC transporter substrate-binding protein [Natrinema versiforme]QCS40810.1 sugar ABC transporter substrate-binding protein [Natrinema versiforme]